MMHHLSRLASLATALMLCCAAALAQGGSTGSLAGTVADQQGAVVAGATVVVKNDATGQEFTATTADNGTFNVPALASGNYTVTITGQGFKQAVLSGVKIDVGLPSSISVALEVGAPTETVTITGAGGELLQTQSATVGTTITGRQIVEQPQASRDALDLITLLPGVQTTGRPRTSTVNGLPKGALNITIDGTDVQDNLISSNDGFFTYVRPRIDAINEVSISTATPGAESSGDGAVQIKFVTRGGTNEFRGSAYWYHREPTLSANYWFNNATLPPDPKTGRAPINRILLNQYGFRAGGPVLLPKLYDGRDKAFWFVNYEEFRLPEQQLRQRAILTPEAQSGVFRYITPSGVVSRNLFELAAAAGLPATPDPTIAALLTSIRSATAQGGVQPRAADPNRMDFSFVGQGGQERYFTTVRFDYNITRNHSLENIWNYQEFGGKPVDFLNSTDPSFPGFPNSAGQISQRFTNTTALRSTLTANIVNEARFGVLGGRSAFGPIGSDQFANQGGFDLNFFDLGITDASAVQAFPQRFNRAFGVNFGSSVRGTPAYNFSDTLTWLKGSHTFNFGVNYNLIRTYSFANNNVVPNVNFGIAAGDPAETLFTAANFPGASSTDLATAAQLYATLTGRVSSIDRTAYLSGGSYQIHGPLVTMFRQPQFALFAQDSWRARPNLTVNLGLRWEPQQAPVSENDSFAFLPYEDVFGVSGVGNLFRPGATGGQSPQLELLEPGRKLFATDYNNFGPTIGVAYSPNWQSGLLNRLFGSSGQSVIRAGYSVAFVREGIGAITQPLQANPGGTLNATRDTALGTLPTGTLFRNRNDIAPPAIQSSPTYPITPPVNAAISAFDPDLRTGTAHSWTVGLQREITKDTVVEARYVGTRGNDLWRRFNLNEINILENGFLNEFRVAQANRLANLNAPTSFFPANDPRRNSFAFTGAPGTNPLPILFSYFQGAGDPTNAALYTSAQFTNATRLTQLNPNAANPTGFAGALVGTAAFFNNGASAGRPDNFFVVNPAVRSGAASLTTNDTETRYDAMQLEVRRRMSAGLLLQLNYTWSKSLTNYFFSSQNTLGQPLTLRPENEQLERFRAPQDLRHTFKINWIYELPFGRGRQWLSNANAFVEHALGGWEWHGTGRVQSGRPFQLGNVQVVGMTVDELQRAVDARRQPNGTVTYLPEDIILNTQRAFSVSSTGVGYSGTAPTGRYLAPANSHGCLQAYTGGCGFSNLILEGPRFVRFDMSVVKRFRFTENTNLELRAEFLNALNNINFLVGGTSAVDVATAVPSAAGTYGTITAAYQDISTTNDPGGRPIQFVIRFNW
jgi:hypothetical protein